MGLVACSLNPANGARGGRGTPSLGTAHARARESFRTRGIVVATREVSRPIAKSAAGVPNTPRTRIPRRWPGRGGATNRASSTKEPHTVRADRPVADPRQRDPFGGATEGGPALSSAPRGRDSLARLAHWARRPVSSSGGRTTRDRPRTAPPRSARPSPTWGSAPSCSTALARAGLRGAHADPARGHPAPARGPRPARAGGDRHRQDGGVRPAPAAADSRRTPAATRRVAPGARAHPRAGHAGLRGDPPLRPRPRRPGAADLRRPADRPPAAGAAARRRRGGRHARAGPRPHRPRHAAARRGSRWWSSTRPTRCSTWASPRTSRRILDGDPRATARRCSSRPRCPRASPRSPRRHLQRPGAHPDRRRAGRRRGEAPRVRQTAYVVPRAHKPAALGRILDVESPAAAHRLLPHARSRSISSPRRSTGAATGPRPCTAG